MGKKKNRVPRPGVNNWESACMNDAQYRFYYEWLEQMACSIYRWENLPPEIDERFLELCLFNRGLSVFFHDEEYNAYFACEGAPSGQINMYRNPLKFIAYGSNGFRRTLDSKDCVPIWNNYLRRPDFNAMKIYARRLADIDRTIDVNLAAQKTPILAIVPEAQRLTAQNLMKQWLGNEPVIIGADGMFDPKSISYLTAEVPFLTNDLLKAKQTVWGEIMTFFGIDNSSISKAERVQSAEVESNNAQIECSRLVRLNCRRMACEEINRKYGLDVWVDMNKDISSDNMNYLLMANPETMYDEGSAA